MRRRYRTDVIGDRLAGLGRDTDEDHRLPTRRPTPQSDWLTPTLQAGTIALAIAVLALGACVYPKVGIGLPAGDAALVAIGVGLLIFVVSFIWLMNRAHRSLYHQVEYRKPKKPVSNRPMVYSARGRHQSDEAVKAEIEKKSPEEGPDPDCPYAAKTMRWFVWHCEFWGSTGHETWDKIVGRKRYLEWRGTLLKAGWAEWRLYGADGKPRTRKGWYLVTRATEVCRSIRENNVEG